MAWMQEFRWQESCDCQAVRLPSRVRRILNVVFMMFLTFINMIRTRRLGVKLDAWSEVEEGQHMDFFNGPALYSLINGESFSIVWIVLGIISHTDPRAYNHTPRLLRFTSLGGVFMTENIIWHNNASYDGSAEASVFPFYQHDLYNAEAPGCLFIIPSI